MKPIWERIRDLVATRGTHYAHPRDNHRTTSELWNTYLRARGIVKECTLSPEDVCMLNVLQKAARLGNGFHEDSWVDIAGYAENVAMLDPNQRNTVDRANAVVASMPRSNGRYFVDERNGCIAVRDSRHPDHDPKHQGLHSDMADVVWFEMGRSVEGNPGGNTWLLRDGARERAVATCNWYESERA